MKSFYSNFTAVYTEVGQVMGAFIQGRRGQLADVGLLLFGVTVLATGLQHGAYADGDSGLSIQFTDDRIAQSVATILTFIEGAFGALVMVSAGLGAIMSCAFGQYRAALSCLVVAVGSFILRTIMETFFNTTSIKEAENY